MTHDRGSESWVVNASPLILLGKIGQLGLLEALAPLTSVPEAVVEELAAGAGPDPEDGLTFAWAKARTVPDVAVPQSIAGWDLGAGESQVLAHCLVGAKRAVLDDGEARAAARVHGVRLIGTLGVILRARRAKVIAAARPVIEQLRERGAYLADDLVEAALRRVGE
jgi:predicted nucleic acid-binding protein